MKDDNWSGMLGFIFMVCGFLLWCNGVAVCVKNHEIFWAVVSFCMPPVGFLIGLYNFVF